MRITTGIAGGRELFVPKTDLRPTQDKVRQAMFSSLGAAVVDGRFLDLFAGSGSVGIEAWSRGAAFVCCVEKEYKAVEAIGKNIATLKIPTGALRVLRADVEMFLKGYRGEGFDLIFSDPPYQKDFRRSADVPNLNTKRTRRHVPDVPWAEKVLSLSSTSPILKPSGLLIFEQGYSEPASIVPGWIVVQEREYGAAKLIFYRKQG